MAKSIKSTGSHNIRADEIHPEEDGTGFSGSPNRKGWRVGMNTKNPGYALNNLESTSSGNVTNTFFKIADNSGNINGSDPYNGLATVPYGTTGYDIPNESNNPDNDIILYNFNRKHNGVTSTTVGLNYTITLNIGYDYEENPDLDDQVQFKLTHSFINSTNTTFQDSNLGNMISYDTSSAEGLANYVIALFKGLGTMQTETGTYIDASAYVNTTASDGITIVAASSESSTISGSYEFYVTTKSRYSRRKISGSIYLSGDVFIKKFDQKPAYVNNSIDIVTKDFDFGFPGVRKKIYKIIITYKAPYAMLVEDSNDGEGPQAYSNIRPSYALNGKMKLRTTNNRDWKPLDVFNLPSNATIDPETGNVVPDTFNPVWIRHEMTPLDGSSVWNNIYTISLRFVSIASVRGFEINDISIIYRNKNIK